MNMILTEQLYFLCLMTAYQTVRTIKVIVWDIFNYFQPDIQFKIESEVYNFISFLDVTLIRSDNNVRCFYKKTLTFIIII